MTETERCIKELELAGLFDKDSDYNGMIGKAIKDLLLLFQKQRHSGFSASLSAEIFQKLIKGENLTPLKGTKEEWNNVGKDLFQNKRNSAIFAKNNKGKDAYYLNGKVFIDKDGCGYTNSESTIFIKFPYMPKTEYIHEKSKSLNTK